MLSALAYLGTVGRGVTTPRLFRADDGKVYVVKLQNNRLGPKILANEFLGARLGELLGLCFPPCKVIEVKEDFLRNNRRLGGSGVKPGKHFACRLINGSVYLGPHNLYKAVNKAEMAGVILFDSLFYNFDRTLNRRNLLIRREPGGYRIYAIDNSHLFRRGKWTKEWLEKLKAKIQINCYRSYGILLKRFLKPEYFDDYLLKVLQLSDECLAEIVSEIPSEWLPHADERAALLEFLIARRDMAVEINNCICALIPNKNRGANRYMGK